MKKMDRFSKNLVPYLIIAFLSLLISLIIIFFLMDSCPLGTECASLGTKFLPLLVIWFFSFLVLSLIYVTMKKISRTDPLFRLFPREWSYKVFVVIFFWLFFLIQTNILLSFANFLNISILVAGAFAIEVFVLLLYLKTKSIINFFKIYTLIMGSLWALVVVGQLIFGFVVYYL